MIIILSALVGLCGAYIVLKKNQKRPRNCIDGGDIFFISLLSGLAGLLAGFFIFLLGGLILADCCETIDAVYQTIPIDEINNGPGIVEIAQNNYFYYVFYSDGEKQKLDKEDCLIKHVSREGPFYVEHHLQRLKNDTLNYLFPAIERTYYIYIPEGIL